MTNWGSPKWLLLESALPILYSTVNEASKFTPKQVDESRVGDRELNLSLGDARFVFQMILISFGSGSDLRLQLHGK